MVRPILAAKIRLGLFENPYAKMNSQQVASDPHHAELARTAAQRSNGAAAQSGLAASVGEIR